MTAATITISLVSHTNVGKTTLARTLLGRDVGEVRDAPHVTEFADAHVLVTSDAGDTLRLADTPGFGDSLRLAKRMRLSATPLGWVLSQLWDRWRDRPFWSTQQALRHVRDDADVVLYLVNAAERPEAAGYIAAELELLQWIGKPVVALLNQLGGPGGDADLQRWRAHLASHPLVRGVLPMDAFARCWLQEFVLLDAVERALDAAQRPAMARLRAAWRTHRMATFEASLKVLAASLGRIGAARMPVDEPGWRERLIDTVRKQGDAATQAAQRRLADELAQEVQRSTRELIALHGLAGDAERKILQRLAHHYAVDARVDEGQSALVGGLVAGALSGLAADLASGGLTLGGGMVVGAVLGALGGLSVARGINIVRGTDASFVAWTASAMDATLEAALLRYLAVAHFGRGRGEWAEAESPPRWAALVADALAPRRDALAALWHSRRPDADAAAEAARLAAAIEAPLRDMARDVLDKLYPGALAAADNPAA